MVNSEVWINKIEKDSTGRTLSIPVFLPADQPKGIAGNSYTLSKDLVLGTYQVWVRTYSTVDPAVVSEWSIAKTFRVTTIPTLIGVKGRTADATPTLTWQGVPGGQTYRVYISSLTTNAVVYNVGNLNSLNPAGWADLRSVTLAAGMNFQQYQVSTASQSLYQNSTRLQGFSIGFPFSEKHGITAAMLFRPYSTVN